MLISPFTRSFTEDWVHSGFHHWNTFNILISYDFSPYFGPNINFVKTMYNNSRSQWSHGLRRRSLAARLLRLWVRIPPRAWIFVCCECCVFSCRGLCEGLIIRSEESYRLWHVVVCDQETSQARRLKPTRGL